MLKVNPDGIDGGKKSEGISATKKIFVCCFNKCIISLMYPSPVIMSVTRKKKKSRNGTLELPPNQTVNSSNSQDASDVTSQLSLLDPCFSVAPPKADQEPLHVLVFSLQCFIYSRRVNVSFQTSNHLTISSYDLRPSKPFIGLMFIWIFQPTCSGLEATKG